MEKDSTQTLVLKYKLKKNIPPGAFSITLFSQGLQLHKNGGKLLVIK
jgi:hypothetical protein